MTTFQTDRETVILGLCREFPNRITDVGSRSAKLKNCRYCAQKSNYSYRDNSPMPAIISCIFNAYCAYVQPTCRNSQIHSKLRQPLTSNFIASKIFCFLNSIESLLLNAVIVSPLYFTHVFKSPLRLPILPSVESLLL